MPALNMKWEVDRPGDATGDVIEDTPQDRSEIAQMAPKSDYQAALDVIIGKSKSKIDGRYRSRTLLEQLVEHHPLEVKGAIERLESRLSSALADGNLDEDALLLVKLEAEVDAMRACLGAKMAKEGNLLITDHNGNVKPHAALGPFCRLTDQLFKVLAYRRRLNDPEGGYGGGDDVISVKKLYAQMAKESKNDDSGQ